MGVGCVEMLENPENTLTYIKTRLNEKIFAKKRVK
jgi:hypothetical protein